VALYTLTLQGNKKYRFLAAGDADARDVIWTFRILRARR